MKPYIAPSILAANFLNLEKEIDLLNDSQADMIHIDVMDGSFVPNISIGLPVVQQIKKIAKKELDVHLMIQNPSNFIKEFYLAGANWLTIHQEACTHLHFALEKIKELGMKAGVSINPNTPVTMVKDVIKDIDLLLIMSVNPGFGGQSFISHTYNKIKEAKQLITETGSNALIEVDGGVNLNNAKQIIDAGVDILVSGSTIFKASDPKKIISQFKNL